MLDLLAHDTALWVAISFVLFCLVAFKLGRKSVLSGLDGKINEVKQEIETAERLRVESQELLAQYQRKQRDAEKESEAIIAHAKEQAKILQKEAETELSDLMDRREVQLKERIQRIEESAIADIRNQAAELAVAATTEVIIQTLDKKAGATLAEHSIQSVAKHLN